MNRRHDQNDRDLREHAGYLANVLADGNLHPGTVHALSTIAGQRPCNTELLVENDQVWLVDNDTVLLEGSMIDTDTVLVKASRLKAGREPKPAQRHTSGTDGNTPSSGAEPHAHSRLEQADGSQSPQKTFGSEVTAPVHLDTNTGPLAQAQEMPGNLRETLETLRLLHASSLGTAQARTGRRRTPPDTVKAVLDRVEGRTTFGVGSRRR